MNKFNKFVPPPKYLCPEEYCFNWRGKGCLIAPGFHNNLEEAITQLVPCEKIGCEYDNCRRSTKNPVHRDRYEPCEPRLERDKLPDRYFVNRDIDWSEHDTLYDAELIEFRDSYLKEKKDKIESLAQETEKLQQELAMNQDPPEIRICDECNSPFLFVIQSSPMTNVCSECAHHLYGYPVCNHEFDQGKCCQCGWDGSRSEYINNLLEKNGGTP